jgi:predicted transcriptional regulator
VKYHRSRTEITAKILEAASGGKAKNEKTRTFKTTQKGLMLLEAYNALVDMMMLKKKT